MIGWQISVLQLLSLSLQNVYIPWFLKKKNIIGIQLLQLNCLKIQLKIQKRWELYLPNTIHFKRNSIFWLKMFRSRKDPWIPYTPCFYKNIRTQSMIKFVPGKLLFIHKFSVKRKILSININSTILVRPVQSLSLIWTLEIYIFYFP